MKHNILVLFAIALFGVFAASCSKQNNSDTKTMDMAKADSNGGGSHPSVSVVSSTSSSNNKGVQVTGSGGATKATFVVTNSGNSSSFNYAANYGPTTSADSTANSGSGNGVSTWTQGPDALPVFWYPFFRGTNGSAPQGWTNYDNVTISGDTVTCTSNTFSNANMVVVIQGGSGGPH